MGIPSFTEVPAGENRFKMIRTVPSFLGTAPAENSENEAVAGSEKVWLCVHIGVLW